MSKTPLVCPKSETDSGIGTHGHTYTHAPYSLPSNFALNTQRDLALPTDAESYAAQHLNLTLVDVVYAWARGVAFADITSLTLVQARSSLLGVVG